MTITIKTAEQIEKMRIAGQLAASVLEMIEPHVKTGVTTGYLDQLCHSYIVEKLNAIPAPLNYAPPGHTPFPKSICTSVNHVVCHGIPGNKILDKGDILNIDVTVLLNGWHGDTSRMFFVGDVSIKAKKLSDITYESMMRGIEIIKPGITTGDIGNAIQTFAESKKYSVVRDFCGHGIGKQFHTPPSVLHFGNFGEGPELRPGMFFTIEPMINLGDWRVKILNDGWTAVTKDKSLSAQFEHTIGITEEGNEIFTLSENNTDFPINDL